MRTAAAAQPIPQPRGEARPVTLLELVQAISEVTADEREIVATAIHMLRNGHVRLQGNFRGVPVEDLC